MKSTRSIQLFAGAITAVLSLQSVQAATGTWNGPTVTGNWDTTETNWTGVAAGAPWAAQGNNAVFDTANNVATVNTSIFVDNWSIASSGNRLTIDAGQTVTAGKLSNGNFLVFGTGHTSNADGNLMTINGTLNFGPITNTSDVFRLGSDNGSNASSYNGIVINSGGMLKHVSAAGGTHNDQVGPIAGANYNYVDINGGTFDRQGNQRFTIGVSGNYNTMTIRNGGTFTGTTATTGNAFGGGGNRVLHIGDQGSGVVGTGSFNSVTINGAGSSGKSTQGLFIGGAANNTDNYLKIEAGGTYTQAFSATNTGQVGNAAGANNNYIQVTGAGSTLNVSNANNNTRNLTIGNNATADNNHLDVFSGALADLRTAVILGASGATNSAFNLGDGTGIIGVSTALVGQSTVTAGAIQLASASARLNINSGRLTANAAGSLVSGAGKVQLNGPAYISTTYGSTISSVFVGAGSLDKEGFGTLDLSNVDNAYYGNTTVSGGTLILRNLFLGDSSTVSIASGAFLDLETAGTDTIGSLYLNNFAMAAGTWGSNASSASHKSDDFFTPGSLGILNVTIGVPEPATALLGGLGLLTILRRRRNA